MVQRLIDNFRRCVFLTVLPIKSRRYFERGIYRYNESASALYKSIGESTASKSQRTVLFAHQSSSKNIFRRLFSIAYRFIHCGNSSSFEGQLMVISSSEKEYKFFDFVKGRLLTVYSDRTRFYSIIENRGLWSRILSVPDYEIDETEYTINECLLSPNYLHVEDYFKAICRDECLLVSESYCPQDNLLTEKHICAFLKRIRRESYAPAVISFVHSSSYKLSLTHGDLWRSNLIWSNRQLYYLDYEQIGERFFLYDIMMFIFSEAFFLNNTKMLSDYLNGRFDSSIKSVFDEAHSDFNVINREVYLLTFLTILYYERWAKLEDQSMVPRVAFLLDEINA